MRFLRQLADSYVLCYFKFQRRLKFTTSFPNSPPTQFFLAVITLKKDWHNHAAFGMHNYDNAQTYFFSVHVVVDKKYVNTKMNTKMKWLQGPVFVGPLLEISLDHEYKKGQFQ